MFRCIKYKILCLAGMFFAFQAYGQQPDATDSLGYPVIVERDTFFFLYSSLGPFTPEDRAVAVQGRIKILIGERDFQPDSILLVQADNLYTITWKEMAVVSITQGDAALQGKSQVLVANEYLQTLRTKLTDHHGRSAILRTLREIGLVLLLISIVSGLIYLLNKLAKLLSTQVTNNKTRLFRGLRIKTFELISAEREFVLIQQIIAISKWIAFAIILYLSLPFLFSIFPGTKQIATTLFSYLFDPLKKIVVGFVNYIPDLLAIIVIVIVIRYVIRLLRMLALNVERGTLVLHGFYPDWAQPTYNIIRFILYIFAFIVIFPHLPGSDSAIFQGVSVFLGLLITLGSSSAIANMIAGLVITYMRPFKVGERVKIGEVVGDVTEKTMLVTRLKTIKNEDITIPNSSILTGHTVNYSTSAENIGLIVHTTVTIGYDVPWREVHGLLIAAALKTTDVLDKPEPFVLQKSLDDFYVSYEINAYIKDAKPMASIYSELYQNIQDAFNEGNVEILSPHYRAARDGNQTTVPSDYLPEDYEMPGFKVKFEKKDSTGE